MWPLSHSIAIVLVLFTAWGVLFFFVTSIIALTYPQSPFRTPSTVICERALQFLSHKFPLCSRFQNDTNAHLFNTPRKHILDARAMTWIMENSVDESAIQSASLSITTLSPRYASEGVLPGTIIRLLIAADIAAGQSAEAKFTGGGLATDIVSTRLRALYHVLRPIVLDSGRWDDLKKNVAFQTEVTPCLRALKSRNLNSESSNLLWMIRFCVVNTHESQDKLMESMGERLEAIDVSDAALHSSSLETLVQHAALLVHVYGVEIKEIDSPAYCVFFEMDRILWAYSLSSSSPPIAVLNYIALIMIHGDKSVSPDMLNRIFFLEEMCVVTSNLIFQLRPNLCLLLAMAYAKICSFYFGVR